VTEPMASEPAPRTRDAVLARVIEEANAQVDDDWTTADTLAFREYFGERLANRLAESGLLADPAQTTELEKLRANGAKLLAVTEEFQQQRNLLLWLHAEKQWWLDQYMHDVTVWKRQVDRTEAVALCANLQSTLLNRLAELAEAAGKQRSTEWLRTCAGLPVEEWPPTPAYKGPMVPRAERDERQARIEEHEDLLAAIWLYVKWRYVTKQLTTEQKNLWADAIEKVSERNHPGEGADADRWWQDDQPERAALAGDQPGTEEESHHA